MRTRDLDQAVDAVTRVFCPHTIEVIGRNRKIDMRLEVRDPAHQPIVELSYGAPVKISTGFSHSLMMHCARGSAAALQEGKSGEWRNGKTMPFSAGFESELQFDPRCMQQCVRIDTARLEELCARWIGRPLDRPLRFELRPLSDELEQMWQRSLAYLRSIEASQLALSPAARVSFEEFLLTMLLHHHPHNFSAELADAAAAPVPGVVRRAERFMAENAEAPITVSDVAQHLGISVRSLQAGFRTWCNATPSAHLRQVRLQRVRDDLLRSDREASVTAIALHYGFAHLGRFSAYYHKAFGESPSVTLRRRRISR